MRVIPLALLFDFAGIKTNNADKKVNNAKLNTKMSETAMEVDKPTTEGSSKAQKQGGHELPW